MSRMMVPFHPPEMEDPYEGAIQVAADAIEAADVSDMPGGTDLYTHFARAVVDELRKQPGLLRALAGGRP